MTELTRFEKIRKINRAYRKAASFILGVFAIVIPILFLLRLGNKAEAVWYDESFSYRTSLTIGNSGAADANKKVKFDIDTAPLIAAGKMQGDCGDSRFTDINGRVLRYFIDVNGGACDGASTDYYVLVPIINSGNTVIYHYYGNPQAVDGTENSQFSEATFSPTSGPTAGSEEKSQGPISYWKFDEGYGTTVQDSMPARNDFSVPTPTGSVVGFEQQINIVDQNYFTRETTDFPTDNSLGLIHWTSSSYPGATVYFEGVARSGTNGGPGHVTLYDSSGNVVTGTHLLFNGTSITRVRSGAITLTDNTDYTVRVRSVGSTEFVEINAARLILVQSDPTKITDTETQIELGNSEGTSAGSYSTIDLKKIYNYDSTKFTPAPTAYIDATVRASKPKLEQQINITTQTFYTLSTSEVPTDNSLGLVHWTASSYPGATVYFEAVIKNNQASNITTARLYDSAGNAVSDGVVTTPNASYTRVRSSPITLTDNTDYTLRISTNGSSASIKAGRLIIIQSDTTKITDTETQIELGSPEGTSGTSYSSLDRKKIYNYDSTKFTPAPTAYIDATVRASKPKLEQQINIIDQIFSTTSASDTPTDNSLGLVHWTSASYTDATVYFEAVILNTQTGALTTATLYDNVGAGSAVAGAVVNTTSAGYTRVRSGAISLTNNTSYTVRIKASGFTARIKAARLIVIQSGATKLTDTETQIEIGNNETSTATSDTQLTDKKIYRYDSSKFTPTPTAYFEATLSNDTADQTTYASLYTDGSSCTTQVSGSEVTVVGTTWTRIRSGSITLSSGTDYMVCVRVSANTAKIANAKIILVQSDSNGITAVEIVHQYLNTLNTTTDGFFTVRTYFNRLELVNFGVYPSIFFEATMKITSGTVQARLGQLEGGNIALTNTTITTTATSYTRIRHPTDSVKDLPQTGTNIDLHTFRTGSGTGSLSTAWLIIQLSNIPTSGGTGYVQLYDDTTPGAVSGSEVTTNSVDFVRVRSTSFSLTTAKNYVIQIKSATIANAKLVLVQSAAGGITAVELIHDQINTMEIEQSQLGINHDFLNEFNLSNFGVYPSIYFEATFKTTSGTATSRIMNRSSSNLITGASVTTTSTSYERVRTSSELAIDFPQSSNEIDTNMIVSGGNITNTTTISRLVIQLSNIPTSGGTGYVQLYDESAVGAVAGSEVTTNSADFVRVRSGSFTLTSGNNVVIQIKSGIIANAKLVLVQSAAGGITAVEMVQQYINTLNTTTSTSYVDQDYLNQFDPGNFKGGGTFTYFYEGTIKTTAGTAYSQLRNDTDAAAITGSEITTTSVSYVRVRSGNITANMPASAKNMDAQLHNSASTNTTSSTSTWLIIQAASLSTTSATAVAAAWKPEDLCLSGKCLQFDGVGSSLSKTYSSDKELDPATGSFSVSAWFRHSSILSGPDMIVARYSSAGFKVYASGSGVCFGIDDDSSFGPDDDACSSNYYNDSNWHFLTAVKNGTTSITLYIDGAQVDTQGSLNATGSLSGSSPTFYIGVDSNGTSYPWDGFLDEIKYYSYARSIAQVKSDYAAGLAKASVPEGTSVTLGSPSGSTNTLSNGLVGYWKMDESSWNNDCSTSTVTDSSGNGAHAMACPASTGPTGNAAGRFFRAGNLDGSNDYLETDNMQLPTSDFTYAAWVNLDDNTDEAILMVSNNEGNENELVVEVGIATNAKVGVWVDGATGANLISTGSVSTGAWNHIVVTRAKDRILVYINGIQDLTTASVSGTLSFSGCQLLIGTEADSACAGSLGNYMDGKIDEVRAYNRALSSKEARELYDFGTGAVAYYKLDEKTSSLAYDTSTNGNTTSTFTGNTAWDVGKFGSGLSFDGNDDVVRVVESSTTDLGATTESYSVSAWIKTTMDYSSNGSVFSKNDGTGAYPFDLYLNSSEFACFQISDGTNTPSACGSTALNDGNWHYLTGIRDTVTDKVYIYVDGTLINSATDTTTATAANDDDLSIGNAGASYTGADFNGTIDEVKFHDHARSAKQIVSDMNATRSSVGSPVGSAVGYWKMDEGYETTAHDSYSTENDLTLSTASWTQSGKFGNAWNGDGAKWLSRTNEADFNFTATEDFSISLWFKSDAAGNPGANQYLVDKEVGTGYGIYFNTSGQPVLGIDSDGTWTPADTATAAVDVYDGTNWHHIVAVKRGTSRIDIYLNGYLRGSDTSLSASGDLTNTDTLTIGDQDGTDDGDEFAGDIDEVKFYRYALSSTEVKTEFNHGQAVVLGASGTTSTGAVDNSQAREHCIPGDSSTCNAAVGWWKLDEGSDVNAYDVSGNGNKGTLTGSPEWSTGQLGKAVTFNDTTQSVDMNNASAVDFADAQDFTIEAWVNRSSAGTNDVIIAKKNDQTTAAGYILYLEQSTPDINFVAADGTDQFSVNGTTTIPGTGWHHIVAVYDDDSASNTTIYLDGRNDKESTSGTIGNVNSLSNAVDFRVGSESDDGNPFNGSIDNVKVYNFAMSAAQAAYAYNRGGPIAWYKFDECSGTTAYNAAPNAAGQAAGANGTITIGAGLDNTSAGTCIGESSEAWKNGATGKFNSSIDLDGNDDFVDMDNQTSLDIADTQDFTLEAWIYRDSFTTDDTVIAKKNDQTTAAGYILYIDDSTDDVNVVVSDGTDTFSMNGTLAITAIGWNHVVVVFDEDSATNSTIYVNSLPDKESTSGTIGNVNSLTNAVDFRVGSESDSGEPFIGQIDNVKLYNYAANATQVKMFYNEGSSTRFGPSSGQP